MFRRVSQILLALALAPLAAQAAKASGSAPVLAVQPARAADLVLLGGGFENGLRQGMVCRVVRDGRDIAELVLVELRDSFSAALIQNVRPHQNIRAGDIAQIKIFKT